jgi:triphosphoribosyl-dephospho-CoA synthetase
MEEKRKAATDGDRPLDAKQHRKLLAQIVNDGIQPSVPEPPPQGGKTSVTQALLNLLVKPSTPYYMACMAGEEGTERSLAEARELVVERKGYGVKKYGGELMTKNGRNAVEDARQEFGDAMQYVMQARMEGLDVSHLFRLHDVLGLLLHIPEEVFD